MMLLMYIHFLVRTVLKFYQFDLVEEMVSGQLV